MSSTHVSMELVRYVSHTSSEGVRETSLLHLKVEHSMSLFQVIPILEPAICALIDPMFRLIESNFRKSNDSIKRSRPIFVLACGTKRFGCAFGGRFPPHVFICATYDLQAAINMSVDLKEAEIVDERRNLRLVYRKYSEVLTSASAQSGNLRRK
ncbi:hypothetical protein CLF_104730 [Clonorchis sinensis]|uniref:Uncharacterized protein n=1 Tax=Clonorchis sinensis TaxID=79923 RepID=G7YC76_CLOSI|nr:hypothetical protein CLF_104730 [Clonorchis sinensis]